jgi:hypothetical protein
MQLSNETSKMVRPEQDLSHATNPTPRSRRNLPRVSHACQRCRAKKAKCDQQQPCLNCVKHAVDCEYGTRRRSGRKKQQAYRGTTETPGARPSPAVSSRSRCRPDESELREDSHATALSGTSSRSFFQAPGASTLLTLDKRFRAQDLVRRWLRRSRRHKPAHSGDRVLRHILELCASKPALCICPTT